MATVSDHDAMRSALQQQILDAYGLKAWHIGLVPVPRRIRIWWAVRRALGITWLIRRRVARKDRANGDG